MHEKWESTPASQIPPAVKRRLWRELAVDVDKERAMERANGWDIEMWSKRKRRRLQELAKEAVEKEKLSCVMKCVCVDVVQALLTGKTWPLE